jgi:type VI secretion system secreted protein VgrG
MVGAVITTSPSVAELFQTLGQTAAARGGQSVDRQGIEALRESLSQWPAPDSNNPGAPLMAVAAEAGITSATPRSQIHYAGENHDTTAQDHLQLTSGAAMRLQAGKGISAFAQDDGISAIANRGKVLIQAQEDDITANAQKNLHLSPHSASNLSSSSRSSCEPCAFWRA